MATPVNKSFISRIIVGVTGALGLGIVYLYYRQQKKDSSSDTAASAKRKKRLSVGGNRVTFAEENEIIGSSSPIELDDALSHPQLSSDDAAAVKDLQEALSQPSSSSPLKSVTTTTTQSSPDKLNASSSSSSYVSCGSGPSSSNASAVSSPLKPENYTDKEQVEIPAATQQNPVNPPSPPKDSNKAVINSVMNNDQHQIVTLKTEEIQVAATAATATAKPQQTERSSMIEVSANGSSGSSEPAGLQAVVTPETDYDRTSMTRELRISRDHVPGLIGRKGVNIRHIQQSSNTSITFKDESLDDGDRVCVIRGQPHDVTVAESLIEKFIMEQPIITTHTLHIPQSSVGRIIGKGGESIRSIQDLSKAKVNVDTNHHHKGGAGDGYAGKTVQVTIRGSEEQISTARQMIIEKVEEEKALRRNIDIATQNRTQRRTGSGSSSSSPGGAAAPNPAMNGNAYNMLPLINNGGTMECFVSCAYHPNDFWIQVMGRESIELDKLTEAMTEWYTHQAREEDLNLSLLEIIAAPFDFDRKMYRAKILKLMEEDAEVIYVDYGDKRVIKQTEIRRLHPEFLKLRFQAIQATLNLGCIDDRWPDATIAEFCDLSYTAQWQSLTAKVKDYLKGPGDQKDIIWVELLDKDINIGDELIRRGVAIQNYSLPSTSANKSKSYASVVAEEVNAAATPFNDRSREDEIWEDNRNGN